jgi:methylenetetrahydrofolate reductase (NADPH)
MDFKSHIPNPKSQTSISSHYGSGKFGLSFELFPPKTPAGDEALYRAVAELAAFEPSFITCTYGAGGSTREKTLDVVDQVKRRFGLPVASHLTVVGSSVGQLREYLAEAKGRQIDYIVALRGDPPKGDAAFQPTPGGLRYANELVSLIQSEFPSFGVVVAGYPETHQEAPSPEADLENLKRKVEAGGAVVVTQLFYHNADFFRFRERYDRLGIKAPLVPGILPVTNLAQIKRITALCGAKLPASFLEKLSESDDEAWQFQVGVHFAIAQTQELAGSGIPGLHFYVLNKSPATAAVLRAVRLPQK